MAFPTVTVTPGSGQTINTLPNAGQTTSANSLPVVVASDQSAISANVSQVGGSAVALGQTTMSASVPVTIASNQSNLPANVAQINGSAVSMAASGVQKVGITGNTGAAFDCASTQNIPTAASMVIVGGEFNTTPTTVTSGNSSPLQMDSSANLLVNVKAGTVTANAGAGIFGTNVAQVGGSAVALGQTTMSASVPVAIASNQSNLPANVAQINGSAVSTATSGVQKVGVTGNAGAAFDAAGDNASAPANELIIGGVYNSSAPTLTSGNVARMQLDANGNLLVNVKVGGAGGSGSQSLSYGTIPIIPTIQNAAYATGNCIGGLQTVSFFRMTSQPSGRLKSVKVLMLGGETNPLTVYIFSKNPSSSTFTDKTAVTLNNTDAGYLVTPPFPLAPSVSTGATQSFASAEFDLPVLNKDGAATVNLYVAFVVGSPGFTPAVGDLVFGLHGTQD